MPRRFAFVALCLRSRRWPPCCTPRRPTPRRQGQEPAGRRRPPPPAARTSKRSSASWPPAASTSSASEASRAHYISTGDIERARWAEDELLQFHRVSKQAFRLELDVPPPTLQAAYNIPEANELYTPGDDLQGQGLGHRLHRQPAAGRAAAAADAVRPSAERQDQRRRLPARRHLREQGVQAVRPGRPLLRALLPVEPQDAVRRPPAGGPPLRAQRRRTQPRHRHLPRHRQPRDRPQAHRGGATNGWRPSAPGSEREPAASASERPSSWRSARARGW